MQLQQDTNGNVMIVFVPTTRPRNFTLGKFLLNAQVKSLIPRKPTGRKPRPHKVATNKPRYNGPVYLPKHIYSILREDVNKELDKYTQEKKGNYKPNSNRMAQVHKQNHENEDAPKNPEPDLDKYHF